MNEIVETKAWRTLWNVIIFAELPNIITVSENYVFGFLKTVLSLLYFKSYPFAM